MSNYEIREAEDGFSLVEVMGAGKTLRMDYFTTREEAEHARSQWKLRDQVGEATEDFVQDMIAICGGFLDSDEIKTLIKDYV